MSQENCIIRMNGSWDFTGEECETRVGSSEMNVSQDGGDDQKRRDMDGWRKREGREKRRKG